MSDLQKKELLEKSGFKCKKCSYHNSLGKWLEVNNEFNEVLCKICNRFAPSSKAEFDEYVGEKVDWHVLEPFRKYESSKANFEGNKQAMIQKAKQGKIMSRPPFGYGLKEGKLIPNQDSQNVKLIFDEFANGKSLNQIAKQYGFSVNGIKKILKNFAYLGKVNFDNQISQGFHQAIISAELFNRVQSMFENKKEKKQEE